MSEFKSQAARDAAKSNYGDNGYAEYLDQHAQELAAKYPAEAEYFLTRSLSEALRGNDGE